MFLRADFIVMDIFLQVLVRAEDEILLGKESSMGDGHFVHDALVHVDVQRTIEVLVDLFDPLVDDRCGRYDQRGTRRQWHMGICRALLAVRTEKRWFDLVALNQTLAMDGASTLCTR